jgi:TRAP-type mannitol/chloroaromatic compound transport system permease small subunit
MNPLLKFADAVDWLNEKLSWVAGFAVLGAALISSGNAFVRYGFDKSSNAWLEIQWYLFAVCVMLGAAYVLKANEHVRVDLVYNKLPGNGRIWLDIAGLCLFLMPVMVYMTVISYPLFWKMFITNEASSNAGGLIRWPAMLMLPLGFFLVSLQGASEIIKRVAHLSGARSMSVQYERPVQ